MSFEIRRERPYGNDVYRVSAACTDNETVALVVDLVTPDGEVRRVGDLAMPLARIPRVRQAVIEVLREAETIRPKVKLEDRRKEIPASHLPWTAVEDEELLQEFDAGHADRAIAAHHQRSVVAIRSRLVRLGRLNDWR